MLSASTHQYRVFYEGGDIVEFLRKYILMISAAAILCGLIRSISSGWKGQEKLMRMMCGVFLLAVACSPLGLFSMPDFGESSAQYEADAAGIVREAQAQAKEQQTEIIISRTRSYIEDEANRLGLTVEVSVTLNEELLPWKVSLKGATSAYTRTRLSDTIAQDLGIPKERQVWSP